MGSEEYAKVLTGTLSNVKVTNTVSDVFFALVIARVWRLREQWPQH